MLTVARLLLVFLAALITLLHGCFPPVSAVAADPETLEVLGVVSSIGAANLALGSLDCPSAHLGVCLVLAICNTDFLFTNSSSCHPQPNTIPHSIHTASSLFALSTWCSLGFQLLGPLFSIVFAFQQIPVPRVWGILPSHPGSVQSPPEGDRPWHSSLLLPFWKKFRYMQCQLVLTMSTRVPLVLVQFSVLTRVQMGIIPIVLLYVFSTNTENDDICG